MAKIINIDTEKQEFIKIFQKAIQSANLNFLIGSGCSNPALKALGNIEQEIQKLLNGNKNNDANKMLSDFLKPFVTSTNRLIKNDLDDNHEKTQKYYYDFFRLFPKYYLSERVIS